MPQLVGASCVICGQRVSSELDARFCRACGRPVHDGCSRPPSEPVSVRQCGTCGSSSASAERLAREQEEREEEWRRASPQPPLDVTRYAVGLYAAYWFLAGLGAVVVGLVLLFAGEPVGVGAVFAGVGMAAAGAVLHRNRPR